MLFGGMDHQTQINCHILHTPLKHDYVVLLWDEAYIFHGIGLNYAANANRLYNQPAPHPLMTRILRRQFSSLKGYQVTPQWKKRATGLSIRAPYSLSRSSSICMGRKNYDNNNDNNNVVIGTESGRVGDGGGGIVAVDSSTCKQYHQFVGQHPRD